MAANLGKVGWIQDCGGFRGAYSVGFAEASWNDCRPSYIQGVSVGALNGAAIAQSQGLDMLKDIWTNTVEIRGPTVLFRNREPLLHCVTRKNSLFSDRGLLLLTRRLDIHEIARSEIELEVAVTNESKGNCLSFFSNRKQYDCRYFRKAVCASASVMGLFPPVEIGASLYSDGQTFDLERAASRDCETIFIFSNNHVHLSPPVRPETMSPVKRMRRAFNVASAQETAKEIEVFLLRHRDFMLWPHNFLPSYIAKIPFRIKRRKRISQRRIVFFSPIRIIPGLAMMSFYRGDITQAIGESKVVDQTIIKTL